MTSRIEIHNIYISYFIYDVHQCSSPLYEIGVACSVVVTFFDLAEISTELENMENAGASLHSHITDFVVSKVEGAQGLVVLECLGQHLAAV